MGLNKFLDDFQNYTVEEDYANIRYVESKGYIMRMKVTIASERYSRIDELAMNHKVAYVRITDEGSHAAPSNTAMSSTETAVLATLAKVKAL